MENKYNVTVVVSTYNGEANIGRQLDSIFAQEGVNISVVIRDDNSSDNTIGVVNEYCINRPNCDITIIKGQNVGFAKSFWLALKECKYSDYYAFSDQDDVWKKDKLYKLISEMNKDNDKLAKLAYCKMQRSDINLNRLNEQITILKPEEITKGISLTKTFNYGAATVINFEARELICRCWPDIEGLPHDTWAGLLCFWFGKVYYVDEELYYWIRYDNSVTGSGTKLSGFKYRLKQSLSCKSYPNVAEYMITKYRELLDEDEYTYLERMISYKKNIKKKLSLLLDRSFKRETIKGTIILKIGVLFEWF